jgi:hypothetical protein
MSSVEFDPQPYDALLRLQKEDPNTARAVDRVVDDLEDGATAPYLKRHYLRPPGIYKVAIYRGAGQAEYMLLWDMEGSVIVVRYVGPGFANL